MTKRKGRKARPIATKSSMHLVLRSSLAKGEWSFLKKRKKVEEILRRFGAKYGVKILSLANAGNHLHLHIQLGNRHTYRPFIRAVTSAVAMAVTGMSRWNKLDIKFWDRRPFTRVIVGRRDFLNVREYVAMNNFEGQGASRNFASVLVQAFFRSG